MVQKGFNQICFISESGLEIGYGHLYRTIAIAKEFVNKGNTVLFNVNNKIAQELVLNHIEEVQFINTYSLEKNISQFKYVFLDVFKTSWVNYKEFIKNNSSKTLFVSILDFPFLEFAIETDFIFAIGFQNYHTREEIIRGERNKNIKVYSGNDFFVFRDEFKTLELAEIKKEVKRIFISMGGSDPQDLTSLVIRDLNNIKEKMHLDLILGAGYEDKRLDSLKKLLDDSNHSVKVHKNINNIATVMNSADLAVINGGNTRFELALLGIPFISIAINEKQKEISDSIAKEGIGLSLNVYNKLYKNEIASVVKDLGVDFNKRKTMSIKMKKAISGNGTKYIYDTLM